MNTIAWNQCKDGQMVARNGEREANIRPDGESYKVLVYMDRDFTSFEWVVATLEEAKALSEKHLAGARFTARSNRCHWCGLPTRYGYCEECGEQF